MSVDASELAALSGWASNPAVPTGDRLKAALQANDGLWELMEAHDAAIAGLRAELGILGGQQQALLDLCRNAEATGRLIHHGQIHELLLSDPTSTEAAA